MADAFTWDACADRGRARRVVHGRLPLGPTAGVDEDRLTAYDDWAHARGDEGARASSTTSRARPRTDGLCMSFCLWDSRAEARAAAGRPAHTQAAALTHEAYAEYTLEFHRVRAARRRRPSRSSPTTSGRPAKSRRARRAAPASHVLTTDPHRPDPRIRDRAELRVSATIGPGLAAAIAVAAVGAPGHRLPALDRRRGLGRAPARHRRRGHRRTAPRPLTPGLALRLAARPAARDRPARGAPEPGRDRPDRRCPRPAHRRHDGRLVR